MTDHEHGDWLTDAEISTVIMALATVRGPRGFTEPEAEVVVDWARTARVEQGLLDGVLRGRIRVDLNDSGEPVFSAVDQPTSLMLPRQWRDRADQLRRPAEKQHAGHDVANLTARRPDADVIGRRTCLTCDVIIGPLVLCGRPTKTGRPCRVSVRSDLGHTTCWSHGAGAGHTNRPRRAS